jgi:ethanolamine utilization protein EutA
MSNPGSKPPPPRRHGLSDHALGALFDHVHAPGEEHDHDHDHESLGGLLPPGAADDVVLTSIGIDIGSSGTQLAIARLRLERREEAADAETRRDARRRETVFQSPIFLTPFAADGRIDEERVLEIVSRSFVAAGLDPDSIDCGAVILTGAARERDNAEPIARRLSEMCGDIVSASAGHHLEARLAAHGSGAVERSAEFGQRYLNIDIGGATTKLAVCDSGRVIATAALAIGGRLVATDTENRIERLEPAGAAHAATAGFDWRAGGTASWTERKAVGMLMANTLVAALTGALQHDNHTSLWMTGPLPAFDDIDGIIVSGGVGEYVYGRESRSFGDLGLALGRALATRIDEGALPWPLMPAAECIRATVLGASSYSIQLSGRTGCISNPGRLLPRRNLPVLQPAIDTAGAIDVEAVSNAITECFQGHDMGRDGLDLSGDAVLALTWQGEPEHARLAALAQGVKRGFNARLQAGLALYVIVDADIAGSLGALLGDEAQIFNDLMVLDGIALAGLDYVDLGRLRLPSETVPVTIKTLVFRDEAQQTALHTRTRRHQPSARR